MKFLQVCFFLIGLVICQVQEALSHFDGKSSLNTWLYDIQKYEQCMNRTCIPRPVNHKKRYYTSASGADVDYYKDPFEHAKIVTKNCRTIKIRKDPFIHYTEYNSAGKLEFSMSAAPFFLVRIITDGTEFRATGGTKSVIKFLKASDAFKLMSNNASSFLDLFRSGDEIKTWVLDNFPKATDPPKQTLSRRPPPRVAAAPDPPKQTQVIRPPPRVAAAPDPPKITQARFDGKSLLDALLYDEEKYEQCMKRTDFNYCSALDHQKYWLPPPNSYFFRYAHYYRSKNDGAVVVYGPYPFEYSRIVTKNCKIIEIQRNPHIIYAEYNSVGETEFSISEAAISLVSINTNGTELRVAAGSMKDVTRLLKASDALKLMSNNASSFLNVFGTWVAGSNVPTPTWVMSNLTIQTWVMSNFAVDTYLPPPQ